MKKILRLVLVLVILLIAAVGVGFLYIDSIAKHGIEKGGTYALGVQTTLDSADVGVFDGTFAMSGLKVANPAGFKSDAFMSLGEGGVSVSFGSLRQEVVELPTLTLSTLTVNLENKDGKANYQTIMDNLKRFESTEPAEEGKRFVIREVLIRDVAINVEVLPLGGALSTVTVPIKEISMKNVGESGVGKSGLTLGELAGLIVKTVFAAAIQNGRNLIPGDVLNGLGEGLKGLEGLGNVAVSVGGEAMKQVDSLFKGAAGELNKVGEGLKGVGEGLGEGLKGVGDGLGGLLGGDKKNN
ncbi:MAG: hypothetical protein HRU76_02235 [Phycisphaeraceae bacterium]|nr:hypothetical protein [Phycisphaerales bacterium]QOJ16479.1 MAG: hypothetical protein HRU76_02235 [Phycisphaeraceae bacterium]